jgi:hypothetical protein
LDNREAFHYALELVKKAGFTLVTASSKTEACYFVHPQRDPYQLRIAMHKRKRAPVGMTPILSKVTILPSDRHGYSEEHTENLVAMAIGRYFLADPKPSEYYGKRGTWENPPALPTI